MVVFFLSHVCHDSFSVLNGRFFSATSWQRQKMGLRKGPPCKTTNLDAFFRQALRDTLLAEPAPSPLQRVDAVVVGMIRSHHQNSRARLKTNPPESLPVGPLGMDQGMKISLKV